MHAFVSTHDLCCCSFSHLLSNKQPIKASETTAAQWSADKAGSQQMHNFARDEKVETKSTLSIGQSSLTWKYVSSEYFLALRCTCYFEKRKRPFFSVELCTITADSRPASFCFSELVTWHSGHSRHYHLFWLAVITVKRTVLSQLGSLVKRTVTSHKSEVIIARRQ